LVFGSVVYVNVDRAGRYSDAVSLMRQTDYQAALDLFVGLGDYEDAPVRADACRDYLAYEAAEVLYQAGDYEAAKQAFEALGDFKDASARALDCQDQLDFQAGQAAYEAGDLEQAIKLFSMLRLYGFPDSDLWYSKAVYGRAAQRLAAGDNYGAYKDFLEAGDYEDAPAQAAACASPFPATGETYHNASYSAWLPEVNFVGSGNAFLVRLYDGTTLVSEVAVNPYEKTTIRLRAGSYTVKLASGPLWFGGDVKFGDEGFYFIVSFSDSGTVLPLDSGISYTWSMPESAVPSAGEWIDREHF
jgi:tetratricopeptide (TPR) repeat protein